jgi:prevent-host-death family protein
MAKAVGSEQSIGIRQLKARLSQCVRDVKRGATIVVTEHGRRVACLVPEAGSIDERVSALKDSGSILWSGRRLGRTRAAVRPKKNRPTVADILVEDRG